MTQPSSLAPDRSPRASATAAFVLLLLAAGASTTARAAPILFPETPAGWPAQVRDETDVAPYLAFHKAMAMARAKGFETFQTANQSAYDVRTYDLDLNANPNIPLLTGSVKVRATVLTGPLTTMELDFYSNMAVDSVRAGGVPASFSRSGNLLIVNLDRPYATGETMEVKVSYHGLPTGGSFAFDSANGRSLIWSLSEPFGARTWWPCKDYPSDKADSVDVRVSVPSGMITASNGNLLESSDDGTTARTHWKERYPITTYLVSVTSYAYTVYSDWYHSTSTDSMEIRFFIYPENAASTANVNSKIKNMIAAFAARFGPYPFLAEKYGEAEFNWGGGMEHQTCTSLGVFFEYVIAHELSHQWWGDMVTCRDFHHVWLNEGFATYSEALWAEANSGASGYLSDLMGNQYFGAGTIYVPDENNENRVFSSNLSYNKPSWVLHMLRHVLGDATFFAALHAYYQQYQYRTAVTEEFRDVCEAVSGRDLHRFFQEWIYGEYYPNYQFGSSWIAAPGGGYDVSLVLEQTQTWQLFWMPVDVTVNTPAGPQTFVVMDSLAHQAFSLHVAQRPDSVQIDPFSWILRRVTGPVTLVNGRPARPQLELDPPRPNPVRRGAMFSFSMPRDGAARLSLFDVTGARVRSLDLGTLRSGPHEIVWDGLDQASRSVPPGVYAVRLEACGERRTQRISVIR
ncbi:MAG: hypothetical protein E6K73_03680 [Candidatus Eisenbacteria bacterium]|uniref:Aminopeptidase N n=1 Tax=Eiseniibacteriota bacterium TaxID=2212470 RepID=A0A538SLA4_UNCEI|nr:MAG: hypothetical protein E6K73_03680 [Candidatus Eisenbacteria bacterium]